MKTMLLEQSLTTIYGDDFEAQRQRYTTALAAFRATYGDGMVDIFRAPGRVNVIGEHTDYNHGYVLPVALDKDLLFLARPRQDQRVRLTNLEHDFAPCEFSMDSQIPSAAQADWSNYVRGAAQTVARTLAEAGHRPANGLDILVAGEAPEGVPRSAGLSSSSALTVVATLAFIHYSNWSPPTSELAPLCSDAEWYVGTRGGIMDQFIALLGARDHALFLDCRPDSAGRYTNQRVPLPTSHRLLIVESGVKHSNVARRIQPPRWPPVAQACASWPPARSRASPTCAMSKRSTGPSLRRIYPTE
ncbi:MAG: hypothetical protein HC802_23325 [Caldilineaceae bacterium]|nr:hypothetical protein [Caldilineaceae bacterium]